MLKLRDFHHLPQIEPFFERLISPHPGLLVIAGVDPHRTNPSMQSSAAGMHGQEGLLPSGRLMIFNLLLASVVESGSVEQAVIVTRDRNAFKPPRGLKQRFRLVEVNAGTSYKTRVDEAAAARPGLLVIDRITPETLPLALNAAERGLHVAAQLDSILWGADVLRQLADMGMREDQVRFIRAVLSVLRMDTLCQDCRQEDAVHDAYLGKLFKRYPDHVQLHHELSALPLNNQFFRAGTCKRCGGTGKFGSMAAFDVLECREDSDQPLEQASALPLEEYLFRMAHQGLLPLEDLERLERNYLRRIYNLLTASETELEEKTISLQGKLSELDAANRVLVQRTEALVTLQNIGQALTASTTLEDFSSRLCRRAADICKADRSVLYYVHSLASTDQEAEILAVTGWDRNSLHKRIPLWQIRAVNRFGKTQPFRGWPPGIEPGAAGKERIHPPGGISLPLLAQGKQVGLLIIQAAQEKSFEPGEIALLQSFATQAALAIQREGLVDELREKIAALEAAQAELVQKERLDRELELACQVQQSVLPKTFPHIPGFAFAALNEPARQVGGDFYDIILLDEDHFGVLIGDVSDKGMPAALFMAITRSLVLAQAHQSLSPLDVLSDVNRLLLELGEPSQFVAVFYGVIDITSGMLRYVRAGHDRPVLLRDNGASPLDGEGMVLGVLEENELSLDENEIVLLPGDRLILYTDGLCDAIDEQGEFYGVERLVPLLSASASLRPEEFCQSVFDSLKQYQGQADQFDDMTMVVMDCLMDKDSRK